MTYETANAKLTGRNRERRKLANNTYLERRADGRIAVRLHSTDILTWYADGSLVLDSGGYRTVTTKARMNEYIPGLIRICQSKGQWYIYNYQERKDVGLFQNGMKILPDGTLEGIEPLGAVKDALKLRRKVYAYAKGYMQALFSGDVPKPGAGDCFYCQMRDAKTGAPLGEASKTADHLLMHIEEKYYVPSLLYRAMEVGSVAPVMQWAIAEQWFPEQMGERNGHSFADTYTRQRIAKVLSKYILKQLGQAT